MDRTLLNIRHLRAFSEVAARGGIRRASERLFLSEPAISQALAGIESRLGFELFDRRRGRMLLTETGEVFLQRVNRALELLHEGVREAIRLGAKREVRRRANVEQMVTITRVRALIAVAHARSFSLAARNLGISQPALHRAARELERNIEVAIFEKTRHGIEITRAAEPLVRLAKLALAELEQGFSEADAFQGRETGAIAVGTLPLARTHILPATINALTAIHPGFGVSVIDGPYDDLLHGLRHGDIDVLVGALRDPPPVDDIVQEPLFDDPLVIVARRDHPLASASPISRRDLAACPWVVPRHGTPTRARFEELFDERTGPRPSSIVESSSLMLIRGIQLDSDRLTLLSARQVEYEVRLGLLRTLAFPMSHTRRTIGLTVRRRWRPTPIQCRFFELLRHCSRDTGDAGGPALHERDEPRFGPPCRSGRGADKTA